jgi:hypothetical protein
MMPRLLIPALVSLALLGCGMPAEVVRIEDPASTPTQGIRYSLKNPSYKVSLEFKAAHKAEPKADEVLEFDVYLEQALESETIYEIRPRGGHCSDTEISVVLESDARLASFTAGTTDKLGEALTAVFGLVVTAAAVTAMSVDEQERQAKYKARLDKLKEYIARTKETKVRIEALEVRLRDLKKDLAAPGATTHKSRFEDIQSLETALEKAKTEVKDGRFKLEPGEIVIRIGNSVVQGKGNDPWITLNLIRVQ